MKRKRCLFLNLNEFSLSTFIAAIGTIVSCWFGGWDAALKVLAFLMVFDYATGLLGAIKTKTVDSEVMFWGGIRKGLILAVIIVSILLDQMLGNTEPIARTLAIYFYISREGISVTENLGVLGMPLPPFISKVLSQLNEKSEEK